MDTQKLVEFFESNGIEIWYPHQNSPHLPPFGEHDGRPVSWFRDIEIAQAYLDKGRVVRGRWIVADFSEREIRWSFNGWVSEDGKYRLKEEGNYYILYGKSWNWLDKVGVVWTGKLDDVERLILWVENGGNIHELIFPNLDSGATISLESWYTKNVDLYALALERLPKPARVAYYDDHTDYRNNSLNTGKGISVSKATEGDFNIAFLYDDKGICFAAVTKMGTVLTGTTFAVGYGHYNSGGISKIEIAAKDFVDKKIGFGELKKIVRK